MVESTEYSRGYRAGELAERERCAKIAEQFLRSPPIIQDTIGETQHVTAKAIAGAIRNKE